MKVDDELDSGLSIRAFIRAAHRPLYGHGRTLYGDLLINSKLPSEKPRLLQTETVDGPGSRIAERLTTHMEAGNRPRKKVPMAVNAVRNERPHTLIKWTTSLTHANKTLDRKMGLSVISLHSLSRKSSGSTHITCHLIHSLIISAKRAPAFRGSMRKQRHSVLKVRKHRKP
jgi:hypothetical protein